MAGIGDLHAIALELLGHAVDALDEVNTFDAALLPAPARQYVSPGLPVLDCPEQVCVHTSSISEKDTFPGGLDAGRRTSRGWLNEVTLILTVVRCIDTGDMSALGVYTAPSPSVMTADSEQLHADAWSLWNHLHNVKASGDFLTLCDATEFGDLLPLLPSGGAGGWTWPITVTLGGYQEPLGS